MVDIRAACVQLSILEFIKKKKKWCKMAIIFGLPSVEMAPCRISYKNIPYRISTWSVLIVSMTHYWTNEKRKKKMDFRINIHWETAVCTAYEASNNHLAWHFVSIDLATQFIELKRMNSILCDKIKLIRLLLKRMRIIDWWSARVCIWRYDHKLNGMPLTTIYIRYS